MPLKRDFETLVDDHSTEIFAYLWRLLQDEASAEDCLQETFLRAYRAYADFKPKGHDRAWLYTIATNVARTHARRQRRESGHEVAFYPDHLAADFSTPREVEKRETLAAVAAAVDELPAKQRAALILRKYQGLSYAEITTVLGGTQAGARANVYQALKRLREIFCSPQDGAR